MEGYIREHRKIMQWRWYHDIAVAHLFRHLILCANYFTADWQDITIYRGQLVTSRQRLAHETGLTEKVVRRCLKALEKMGEISLAATNHYTTITICNYMKYQGDTSCTDQPKASKRPAEGQLRDIKEKGEESNNSRSSLRSGSSSMQAPISEDRIDYQAFMQFFNKEMAGKVIPRIVQMNKLRKGTLNARVKEYGKEAVAIVVRKAAASTWLNGGGGHFVASFDWLFKPKNFIKVYEGNYDDHRTNSLPASGQASSESVYTNSNTSITTSTNNSFKYSSYEQHRKDEQQKRLEGYSEAISEILDRR